MPNNTRTQPDGTWVDGYTPPKADWEDLERKVFEAWNGDKGGAYAPPPGSYVTTPYVINGAGLQVVGPTRVGSGGSISGAASAFVIRDGTWPQTSSTHIARARQIVQSLDAFLGPKPYLWSRNHPYSGIGSIALSVKNSNSRIIERPEFYAPVRAIDGAKLLYVAITFRVATKRTLAPAAMPKFRVMRVHKDSFSNPPQPLKATADGLGFDSPPLIASADEWYANGEAQTFIYYCDQNNVMDVSTYSYLIHVVEEAGAVNVDDPFDGIKLCERKNDVTCIYQNPGTLNGDQRTDPYCDTQVPTGSQRVLVIDTPIQLGTGTTGINSVKNGIWIGNNGGAWLRSEDCDSATDFTPNWIVYCNKSQRGNQGVMWQCQYPSVAQPINLSDGQASSDTKTQIRMIPAEPKGNIYHTITPTYEVDDLRFQ